MNVAGEFILAWPWALLMLPLPLLIWWLLPPLGNESQRALRVPNLQRFEKLKTEQSWRTRLSALLLLAILGWLLLVAASARPQWLGEPVSSIVTGRDLLLCIDISGSMDERDLVIGRKRFSRMEVVRQLGSDFISRRTGDRVGLIMFGSQAYVQTPLTFDHQTVQHFLGEAHVGLAGKSTAIGDAIGLGIKRLRDRPEKSRVLILITDGANSAGVVQPLEAAEVAAQSNIRIHTIGVGSESQGLSFNQRFQRQSGGLDEATLQKIAELSGGQYFRARDVRELEAVYAAIERLEPVENEEQSFRPLIELFPWPLGLALLLSMLAAVLQLRRSWR